MNKRGLPIFSRDASGVALALKSIGRILFLSGVCTLFFGANDSGGKIEIEMRLFAVVMVQFLLGYLCVFLYWVFIVDRDEIYKGGDVSDFITSRLFGEFPYLFSFRAPKYASHGFHDPVLLGKMNGKKFADVYCRYVSEQYLYALVFVIMLLPASFFDLSLPQVIEFLARWRVGYSLILSFLVMTWLSAIALLVLRVFFMFRKYIL